MLKMKDFLLVVVVGYAIYQIGWVDGWTGVNIFLLICSLLAGKLKRAREEEQRKEEGKEQDKQP